MYVNDSLVDGNKIWLNNFYGGGVNDSWNNNSYCVNISGTNEGNYHKWTLGAAAMGWNECGMALFTNPAMIYTLFDNSANITWRKQSSANSVMYYLHYSNDSGTTWNYIGSTQDTNYTWDTSSLANLASYVLRVTPYDNLVNATINMTYVFRIGHGCEPPYSMMVLHRNTTLCSGTFYLSLSNVSNVITLENSSITLTCLGTHIIGNRNGTGVLVNKGYCTVKNCIISNYSTGIYSSYDHTTLLNNTVFDNAQMGIFGGHYFDYSDITNNTVYGNYWA